MTEHVKGRPPISVEGYEGAPLKILNCKVPEDVRTAFQAKARVEGFKSASAKLRTMVMRDLSTPAKQPRAASS